LNSRRLSSARSALASDKFGNPGNRPVSFERLTRANDAESNRDFAAPQFLELVVAQFQQRSEN
jgi:hypothetical protein